MGYLPSLYNMKIKPLFKGGDKVRTKAKSFRPVSLLSALGRIMDGILAEQLDKYMEHSGQLPDELHGYRNGLGTTTGLLDLWNDLIKENEKGNLHYLPLQMYHQDLIQFHM